MSPRFNDTQASRVAPPTVDDRIVQLIDDIARELADREPGDDPAARLDFVQRHVLLRSLYLATGESERAQVPIPGLDDDEQTFWQNYIWATANYFDDTVIADPRQRAGEVATQLRHAIKSLQAKAHLKLQNVAFCSRIASYGNYVPFEKSEFGSGKEVLVYAEVENFRSELTTTTEYRTLLHSTAEFYDSNGQLIGEPIVFGNSEDLSRNQRRDFFLAFQIPLPDNLPPGPYTMKLIVKDTLSGRSATKSPKFTIR